MVQFPAALRCRNTAVDRTIVLRLLHWPPAALPCTDHHLVLQGADAATLTRNVSLGSDSSGEQHHPPQQAKVATRLSDADPATSQLAKIRETSRKAQRRYRDRQRVGLAPGCGVRLLARLGVVVCASKSNCRHAARAKPMSLWHCRRSSLPRRAKYWS